MEQQENSMQQPAAVLEPVLISSPETPAAPLRDRVLALGLLALRYLVCRVQIHDWPLLGLVYGLVLYGLTLWHFRFRPGKRALVLWTVGLIFLLSHLLTDNGPVRFFARWLAVLLWGYGVYCAGGNGAEDMALPEFFKANVLMPFSRLSAFFSTVFGRGRRNGLKTALLILLGLGLALIPLLAVVNLLQYDAAFSQLLSRLVWEDLPEAVVRRVLCLAMAVWMTALLMSAIWGSEEHRLSTVLDRDRWNAFCIRIRFLPLVVSAAMLIPLLLVYGLFFFSQLPLYTSAFTGVLPQGYTYADYAREGFFQLCAVCAINGALYLFVSLFTQMGKGRGLRQALLTLLCLCSLILAATAASKMVLYIRSYGLTPLRVYSSWAMALLVGAFLLALLGACWKRLDMVRALSWLFTVLFGLLCLVDTNALIADYNVTAYEQGRLSAVDTSVFWDLGDSAAPAAVRLVDDPTYGEDVKSYLRNHGERTAAGTISHGLPGIRAQAVCRPYWPAPEDEIRVKIQLDLDEDIGLLIYEHDVNGTKGTGGVSNADKSMIRRDSDDLDWSFEKGVMEAPADQVDVRLRFSVVTAYYEPNFDNIYPEENVIPMNELAFPAAFGETYHVTITGDKENGYRATLDE